MKRYQVSVGELARLCQGGDINFRFSTRSSALEGIRGHQRVQKARGEQYIPEYAISVTVAGEGSLLALNGRVDGIDFDADRNLYVIEEIKTIRVAVEDIPSAVMAGYWHQALLYASLINVETQRDHVLVRLCFFHLDESTEERIERLVGRDELAQLLTDTVNYYLDYLARRAAWFEERSKSLSTMKFPYSEFRDGQRDLSVAVYRALNEGQHLVLEAPTGLGKTMGTLFPAIGQLAQEDVKRVMYVSARTSTQQQALVAIRDITASGIKLRSVILTAKDKICFSPGEPCHPDHCEYAKGYYDKLPEVLENVLASDREFTRERVEILAREKGVCPFELGLDLASECDVIISDYNYVFDPVVYLRRFFDEAERDTVVLVDEAHNLVDRGRQMFSSDLLKENFLDIARLMKASAPAVCRAAKAVNRAVLDIRKANLARFERDGHIECQELPKDLLQSLRRFSEAAEEELRLEKNDLAGSRDQLLELYFDSLRFIRTAEWFDDTYVFLMERANRKHRLKLYCVDPSGRLGEVFQRLAGSVTFSATLQPATYFRQMMGVPDEANWYRLASPFPADNLHVSIAPYIDTSFRGRDQSVSALCTLIHDVVNARRGNYLVFFPSYHYLEKVEASFRTIYPEQELLVQQRSMDDEARANFLRRYESDSENCGFAVMGGAFSEGIDLKGNRLIGVIVVGVGLPQVGVDRDLIRGHFGAQGFKYAYQYPGLTRVLQTAGRLIRDEADEGVLCLVDQRYSENRYRSLLPAHWQAQIDPDPEALRLGIQAFWDARSLSGNSYTAGTELVS